MADSTPPPLHGPSSKEKKYDRQLRLWAASGQQALEDSHVLLVNSAGPGVVGVETLKNLVLPGIGHFTIVDPATVSEDDLGVNFFLDEESLGQSRAKRCYELLEELNPDVEGHYIAESIENLLEKPDFLSPYTLILLVAPIPARLIDIICRTAHQTGTPVFYIHSVGFYAHFSLLLPSAFPIVDTHPDPASTTDLRLLEPWPELSALVEEKARNLDNLSDYEHGHVPYVLLLLYYLERWKKEHNGQVPQNYKQKSEFRELVRKGARTNNPEGGEENFDEAIGAVLKSLHPSKLSSAAMEVFEAEECQNITKDSQTFWVIAAAIRKFYLDHKATPLPGAVPDMKAQSADYIKLQNVYKTRARADFHEVLQTVRTIEKNLGRTTSVDEKEVEAFCKGAAFVKLIRGRPFHIAGSKAGINWGHRAKFAYQALQDPSSLLPMYLGLLAVDTYHAESVDKPLDESSLLSYTSSLVDNLEREAAAAGSSTQDVDLTEAKTQVSQVVQELIRHDGAELHNISALAGGMIAQEVIKVITRQYIPIDNTCLFDGIGSRSSVLRL
ncbi:ubiquitin-like activating enzyme [Xylona heveae TC161]|uniref:NEDD8-activating enzyme E1 regulatory subunit n=1 Tax=Xylona heveae (strain CBS 132557 / TC161) TaxID=1328760 RepID=A0A164ZNI6_XYLHT|nr:ubiquitin-like activating enzyme [Xylona heveae TC161]KZF19311.1 ubiquitin-like activating enzyme [Xylona heveae TC161]